MREGVKIAVDLSLPADLEEGERIPAILRQTRYFRSWDVGWPLSSLADRDPNMRKVFVTHGYAGMHGLTWTSVAQERRSAIGLIRGLLTKCVMAQRWWTGS